MEKYQMDFDEWEFLPDTEFLDYHENGKKGKKERYSRQAGRNYLIIQNPTSPHIVTTPVPVQVETSPRKKPDQHQEQEVALVKDILPITLVEKKDVNLPLLTVSDQETVSRVFFKKNEFVDMKMGSPKATNRGVKVQTDAGSVQFEEKEKEMIEADMVKKNISKTKKDAIWKGSVKIMGWKITGIEALCCVGIAAATTVCIFIFGRKPINKQIQFQIYSENKKTKQVKAESNEEKSEAKASGSHLNGSHIIFGSF